MDTMSIRTIFISVIFLISLTLNTNFVFGDPCTTYQELGTAEDFTRSVANSEYDNTICDDQLTEGWYKISSKAGERMPTECILGGSRCGAQSPIWMNGTFPETGNVNNVTGYVANFMGNCYAESFDIQVKNCSSFLVYYLKPVSNCNQRYCFGTELPCPNGKTSDNGFSPGCKYDPCLSVNYKDLDQWKRSTGNQDTSDLCDNFIAPGWYRPISLVGNVMPTQCQTGGFSCGTSNPIWMNGSHPVVGQTADVTACVSSYHGDCCSQTYNIQVKNCDGYYVYNLTHTNGCHQAYCFGNESKCPVGETSDNEGFTPGCEFDPCHESNYEILQGEMRRSSNYTLQSGDTVIEDSRLRTGWYKIDSVTGNDIVNETVGMMQCGTLYPLWLQGGNPSVAEKTVDRKVCRVGLNTDCEEQYDIKIRNCGSYRTYYLNQLNVDKAAYCFGTLPVPPPTTTTTTTEDPHENGDGKEKGGTIVVVIVLVPVFVCIIFVSSVIVYKHKTKEKRAISFVNLDRGISPPPSYEKDTANRQPPSYTSASTNNENPQPPSYDMIPGNIGNPPSYNEVVITNPNLSVSIPPTSTNLIIDHNYM